MNVFLGSLETESDGMISHNDLMKDFTLPKVNTCRYECQKKVAKSDFGLSVFVSPYFSHRDANFSTGKFRCIELP